LGAHAPVLPEQPAQGLCLLRSVSSLTLLDGIGSPQPPRRKNLRLHGKLLNVALFLIPNSLPIWPLALPLLFLGVGLMIYYALGSKRTR